MHQGECGGESKRGKKGFGGNILDVRREWKGAPRQQEKSPTKTKKKFQEEKKKFAPRLNVNGTYVEQCRTEKKRRSPGRNNEEKGVEKGGEGAF